MRIKISDGNKKIRLIFPTSMVFNPLGFAITKKVMKTNAIDLSEISSRDVGKIYAAIKKCKRLHHGWKLVEVCSADGEAVEITL